MPHESTKIPGRRYLSGMASVVQTISPWRVDELAMQKRLRGINRDLLEEDFGTGIILAVGTIIADRPRTDLR
jgi:hypothetical protein